MNYSTIIWVVVAIILYLVGFYEGRSRGYKKRKAEEMLEMKVPPPNPPAPAPINVDDPGLMRIKNDNGYLTLDLDGTRVDTSALTSDQRKRLIEMLNVIRPWLEGRSAPASLATPAPHPSQPKIATPPPPVPSLKAISQPVQPQPSQPVNQKKSGAAKEEPAQPTATGIVGQIDMILQARLAGTPLASRAIYLSNSPEGGVIVNIGMQKFNGIDEVTDPEIKAALRAAVTEWENKYTPGL